MGDVLWRPDPEAIARARVTAFRRAVSERYGLDLRDWPSLWRWSVDEPARFWESVWRFCDVRASRSWDEVLVGRNLLPGARWFTSARLNFAENLLRRDDDTDAIVFRGEGGGRRRVTHAGLRDLVARLARALRRAGVGRGDRVAGFLPNVPEAVAAMLASASIGAVWSSCSPDFGIGGVLDRFGQIEPKVLFTADGYVFGGKRHDSLPRVRAILDRLPSVRRTVVVPNLSEAPDLSGTRGAARLDEFVGAEASGPPDFEQLPFDHPLFILYSSGTTGLPKCMVHSAGGTLLQHLKEHALHCDVRSGERTFFFTTCGWMMWNWLASALASESTIMLYDGSPLAPATALWDYAAEERIEHFGTSARFLAASEKAGLRPAATHDLGSLRSILSTGSPLGPESFDWVYGSVKRDVRLSSISGGTDIVSCFVLGSPVLPVVRGEIQCIGLGMKVEVFDPKGESVVGRKGELVCTAPFPSMPLGFWNDPDGSRYRAAYFERYPGVWRHGDWMELTAGGGAIIYGRSDAVLNPGGVRIGTAEIYRVVERLPEVLESLAVGQDWDGDERIVLFVRMRDGIALDDRLRERIRAAIRAEETPRHVPAKILAAPGLPRTLSGKLVELAVREVIHGRPVANADALANPETLEFFRNLPELRT